MRRNALLLYTKWAVMRVFDIRCSGLRTRERLVLTVAAQVKVRGLNLRGCATFLALLTAPETSPLTIAILTQGSSAARYRLSERKSY